MSLLRSLWGDLFDPPQRLPASRPAATCAPCISGNTSNISRSDRPDARFQTYQPDGEFSTKEFRFDFEYVAQTDGTVRAYIIKAPGYGNRDDGPHKTHRFYDSQRKLHYICYDPMPRNQPDALQVSAKWADHTLRYIHYGTRF